jgi:hypothetical protein
MFTKQVCSLIGKAMSKNELVNSDYIIPSGRKLPSKTVHERQIKKLSSRHYQIMELLLAGTRPRDIAKVFGIGRQWLSVIMNSPVFLEEMNKRLTERFQEIGKLKAERAIDKLERELYFRVNLADAVHQSGIIVLLCQSD